MIRVLIAVSPQMYRQAIALAVQRRRSDAEVRMISPEAAEEELARFQPHLLVYNDTAPCSDGALEGVPFRVEVLYSDSMNARVHANGRVSEAHDAGLECLFDAVEEAVGWVCAEEGA